MRTRAPATIVSILLAFTAAVAALAPASAQTETAPQTLERAAHLTIPGEQWKLRWHDEFNGSSLDQSKWKIGLPWRGTDGEGRHHNDLYASYIMDHNVVVADGTLKLLTRREDVTAKNGRTFHFTQGLITTAQSFRHRYGYWEARVKIPVEAGPGLWPAFWTLAEGWPPEMDICEVWTSTNRNHQGLCYRPARGAGAGRRVKEQWDDIDRRDVPLPTGWTTFGMEWGAGYQVYNVAGRVTKRVYGDHVTQDKHYVILNSGVDAQDPPTNATVFPNAFLVDYVRVYERPDVSVVHNGGFEDEDGQRPWSESGQVVRVAYGAHDGDYALRIDGGPATSEQKIYGLEPRATYVLSAWAKLLRASGDADDGEARLGVKEHGGEEVFRAAKSGDYQQVEVAFATGAKSTTATIYCYVPGKTGAALFDDVALRRAE